MSTLPESPLEGHLRRLHALAAEIDIEADLYASQCGIDPRAHDEGRPTMSRDTIPDAVLRGRAQMALAAALADLSDALGRLEALAEAFARALDSR